MPKVEMRRSTRVFGARVLRSGRRLWTGPVLGEGKYGRAADGEEWIELLENSGDGGGNAIQCKENGRQENGNDVAPKHEISAMEVDVKMVESESEKPEREGSVQNFKVDRFWGAVYTRKRKRAEVKTIGFMDHDAAKRALEKERRFGKQFVRRQWNKKYKAESVSECCDSEAGFLAQEGFFAIIVADSSYGSILLTTCFMTSVLNYMRRVPVDLQQLFLFVNSKPIAHVYSSQGVHFLQGSTYITMRGACIFSGLSCSVPLFTVDFSAIPSCFMYLHSSLLLRSVHLLQVQVMSSLHIDENDDKEQRSCFSPEINQSECSGIVESVKNKPGKRGLHLNASVTSFSGRNMQLRSGRHIQKRRTSLRSNRGRRPSIFTMQRANGTPPSDSFNARRGGLPLCPVDPNSDFRTSGKRSSTTSIKELKSTSVGMTLEKGAVSCCANILVIESDKCYREEGAVITLEVSTSKQWFLAVKRNGIQRYSLVAQKVMRPSTSNRVTHAMIWTVECGWKLEFPNRQDWLIFKELYKECSDRNVQSPVESAIPVPGVRKVPDYVNSGGEPFVRPDSYIMVKDDELTRALARKSAIYDMDSDDEEWLNTFNSVSCAENGHHSNLSAESFELIIDAFEKGFYCNPDDYSDDKSAVNVCVDIERKVAEAVYSYWTKKRKQKRSALVRIFQCYQPRRTQLIPKSILRKKRSFKRQGSQAGRGKQRTFLQAMAVEQDAMEQQSAILKVQEAKAAADKSEGLAVLLRRKAQQLMENADLATYKATMALRIAEAARIAESAEPVASLFLS